LQGPSRAPRATLLVAADGKSGFSGFHAANLAAAFASKRLNTSLFELSGLLPNAGYFMALPPHRYIRWNEAESDRAIPVMAGIKMCFSLRVQPGFGRRTGRPRMDLFHLPPVFPRQAFRSVLDAVSERVDQQAVVLLLRSNASKGALDFLESVLEHSRGWTIFCVDLNPETASAGERDPRVTDLGHLGSWVNRLSDRIPTAIRIPESALARTYSSLCDTILFRINQSLKKAGATHAGEISRQIQPG
jgi:hypothetical protein